MKKKVERKPMELGDRPVPPVKGAVTEPVDLLQRPSQMLENGLLPGQYHETGERNPM